MKLSQKVLRLLEAKEVFWHGTSSVAARKILKTGLDPREKRSRVWGEETGGKESFPGNYLTQNLITATGSANAAVRKFGGFPVVFEVQIETRTSLYDEDILPTMANELSSAYSWINRGYRLTDNGAMGYLGLERRWGTDKLVPSETPADDEGRKKLIDLAVKFWLKKLTSLYEEATPKGSLSPKVFAKLKPVLEEMAMETLKIIAEKDVHGATGLSVQVGRYRELVDQVNQMLRGMPAGFPGSQFMRNVRMTDPITFKGSNRITGAATAVIQDRDIDIYLLYGQMSDEFFSNFRARVGDYREVKKATLEGIESITASKKVRFW